MSFLETVEKARAFLERNGRVSLRALQHEFNLDDDALGELIEELAEIQRVAVRDGRALPWPGAVPPAPTDTPSRRTIAAFNPSMRCWRVMVTPCWAGSTTKSVDPEPEVAASTRMRSAR